MARDHDGACHILDHPSAAGSQIPACEPRRVRLVLRDQRVVDAQVHLPDGVDLATFLGSRDGGWLNLTDVCWQATGERTPHVVLKVGLVLWAGAIDATTPLGPRLDGDSPREVELMLENRITLRAELPVPTHRLTDVLREYGGFIPLWGARMADGEIAFGDVVVNSDAIHLVQDLPTPASAEGGPGAGGARRADLEAEYLAREHAPPPASLVAAQLADRCRVHDELLVDPYRPIALADLEVLADVPRDGGYDPSAFHFVAGEAAEGRA